jgi:hypothetical protein
MNEILNLAGSSVIQLDRLPIALRAYAPPLPNPCAVLLESRAALLRLAEREQHNPTARLARYAPIVASSLSPSSSASARRGWRFVNSRSQTIGTYIYTL